MADDPLTPLVVLKLEGGDALARDEHSRRLRRELLDAGFSVVAAASGTVPPAETKAVEAFTLGALTVAVLPALAPRLVEFLQAWTTRTRTPMKLKVEKGARSVEVEFVPEKTSPEEVKAIVGMLTDALEGRARRTK